MEKGTSQQWCLDSEQRKLFNVLEIRMYDILQNGELLGKQLTNNQVLDNMSHAHQLCHQLRPIFQHLRALPLYNVLMKVQTNSLLLTNLLVNRNSPDKLPTSEVGQSAIDNSEQSAEEGNKAETDVENESRKQRKVSLGGIWLYNEDHRRGILNSKCKCQNRKTNPADEREALLRDIAKELQNQTDVEVTSINDQIRNHIASYKDRRQDFSSIDYEKQFGDIIDFFKVSQKEAMSFLHQSPKTSKISEELGQSIEEIEKQIRQRQKAERIALQQKLCRFIEQLRGKVARQEAINTQKEAKLAEYQKSLIKQTHTLGTQTSDQYQKMLRNMQQTIKQHQERYDILAEVQKKEIEFEDKYHSVNHTLDIRTKQNQKLKDQIVQISQELEQINRSLREQKNAAPKKVLQTIKSTPKKKIYPKKESEQQLEEMMEQRESRIERRPRRTDKFVTRSSSSYRASFDIQQAGLLEAILSVNEGSGQPKTSPPKLSKFASKEPTFMEGDERERALNMQSRKGKKAQRDEEEKQVTFGEGLENRGTSLERIPMELDERCESPRYHINSRVSIDNQNDDRQDALTRKNSRKNTLRQKVQENGILASQREIEAFETKYSSKNISVKTFSSKKGIFLKQQKDRSAIVVGIKRGILTVQQAYNIHMLLQSPTENSQQKVASRVPRASYPALRGVEKLPEKKAKNETLRRQNHRTNNHNKSSNSHSRGKAAQQFNQLRGGREHSYSKNKLNAERQPAVQCQKQRSKQVNVRDTADMLKSISNQPSRKILKEGKQKSFKQLMDTRQRMANQPIKQSMTSQHIAHIIDFLASRNSQQSHSSLREGGLMNAKSKKKIKTEIGEEGRQLLEYWSKQLEKGMIDPQELKEMAEIIKAQSNSIDGNQSTTHKRQWRPQQNNRERGTLFDQHYVTSKTIGREPLEQGTIQEIDEKQMEEPRIRLAQNCRSLKAIIQAKNNNPTDHKNQDLNTTMPVEHTNLPPRKEVTMQINVCTLQKITQLHKSKGKCSKSSQGGLCEHLQKYLAIIERVKHLQERKKVSLHLPVENIGEAQYWHLRKDMTVTMGSGTAWSQENSREVTQQRRTNILPIITSTTTGYYRSKQKHFN